MVASKNYTAVKQKIILLLLAGLAALWGGNCIPAEYGVKLSKLTLFIGGDTGKTVTIAHLQKQQHGNQNEEVIRSVTIPFFGELVTICRGDAPCDEAYVKVSTDGETCAKVVTFDGSMLFPRDSSLTCALAYVLGPLPAGDEYGNCYGCDHISYCHTCPVDSVYEYLERIKYPAYKVISKGETFLELNQSEAMRGWKNPHANGFADNTTSEKQ